MKFKDSDEYFMRRALFLASKGSGYVAPNPLVGAVIVKDNKIIGEGFHEYYGQAHAEVNAVNTVKNYELLKSSTIYVTLEPCAHFGKTPPCSDLIIQHQFQRVVVACIDPFAEVSGKGIQKMRAAGIQVDVGLLEKEAKALNKKFFTFHQKKRPYITLKWAQTKDGFLDKKRKPGDVGVNWITQPETKLIVHALRAENAGILVGVKTILADNPLLNVRHHFGPHPHRFILDPKNEIPLNAAILNTNKESTTIFNEQDDRKKHQGVNKIILTNFSLSEILTEIYKQNILSILVEGGAHTLNTFLHEGFWDEAHIFTGNCYFKDGLKAPNAPNGNKTTKNLGVDTYQIVYHPNFDL
ncbi:MAG: bifunctional diaminohydroxyphosphoribosylaminopyrimidine deaminase/5-amino-6-(5-phosphoribosylamino)uracil reductase RibD [Crocinitomicaceae bacterium]|nr:bifunctional diaminohydroxyphosphoribosylaminopyrimidine deaminase/5-amino-6-(5-phosphoribosylamino)uracil reductase RibD [Crocinitomicaceae bacterium]